MRDRLDGVALAVLVGLGTADQRDQLSFEHQQAASPSASSNLQQHQHLSPSQHLHSFSSQYFQDRILYLLFTNCSSRTFPTRRRWQITIFLSPVMQSDKIPDFLAEQREQAPEESQALFLSFEDFWERKLWHQLTNSLIEFFCLPESAPQRLAIFKSFILSFADKINQLKFVTLGLMASTQCGGSFTFGWGSYMSCFAWRVR